MLPPGRARLCTKPCPTGSDTLTKTIGMVRVCCRSAATAGVLLARIASGDKPTSSAAEERRITRGKAIVDPDILTLDPAQAFQRTRKGRESCPIDGIVLEKRVQYAEAANPLGLLRVPGKRPC